MKNQKELKVNGLKAAAIMIAEFVREGITFEADCDGEITTIVFTGGF